MFIGEEAVEAPVRLEVGAEYDCAGVAHEVAYTNRALDGAAQDVGDHGGDFSNHRSDQIQLLCAVHLVVQSCPTTYSRPSRAASYFIGAMGVGSV
jgi:hypothetical protein